jgi:hypothetical protein
MAITKPTQYVPSFLRTALSGSRPIVLTWSDVADTNIASTSSFMYDPVSSPLKSTQQLNVDWSRFENHTFFMSAEAKVNLAFENIINGFPFDGARKETEFFFDRLSGFDRWVFDNFPRYRGALGFVGCTMGGSGTQAETGTFIKVENKAGALFPELSRRNTAQPILNPTGSQSMTVEMQLYLPNIANDVQTVVQMMSGSTQGFAFQLLPTVSTSSCTGQFSVVSGTFWMSAPMTLTKGKFNHVALSFDRDDGTSYLQTYLDSVPVTESPTQVDVGDMEIDASQLLIGSGTSVTLGFTPVTPTSTLSGSIDELRIYHSVRTPAQQAAYAAKSVFSTRDLILYYRFNEPPPPITVLSTDATNAIVLDSSGNSLHALISNFTGSLRLDASIDPLNPMVYESPNTTPVLFPAYPQTIDFNAELLMSASEYDAANPNLITRMIPQHYLLEGALQDGFSEPEGSIGDPYAGSGIPGQGKMGNVQIMVSLLYIWARFFDDIKLFVDSFSTLRTVDYDTNETIPDSFLLDLVKDYGFNLPPLFNDSTIDQYIHGDNIDAQSYSSGLQSLKSVQNTLLRRVLVNLPDVLKSKGTQHSIKSFLRAVGIDPGNNVRIREYGGPTTQQLAFSRESKLEQGAMVQFISSSLVVSPFLSASRTEPGFPYPTSTPSDGLLTSGSWTVEAIVKYTPASRAMMQSATQSLMRMCVTGSTTGSAFGNSGLIANLVAVSSSFDPRLSLYIRPGDVSTSPLLRLDVAAPIPGIFNNDQWNVSFGCRRGDDGLNSVVSSSYFLRLAYQNAGQLEVLQATSSYFLENPTGTNVLRSLGANNRSGSYLSVGSDQSFSAGSGNQFLHLNDISSVPDEARNTDFSGRMSNVRFWSKAVTDIEWKEHVRNFNSIGVEDPTVNWNYVTVRTGSFGRLRMNSCIRQDTKRANATASMGPLGDITFIDFSESGFHLTGSGFPIDMDSVVGDVFDLSYISPYFDEASSDVKVRSRSFQSQKLLADAPWAAPAPVYEILPSEQPTDDVRFTVEFSLLDALNRDIITMFATLRSLDNALGAPDLMFSPDYPDLEVMRDIYFNRIKEKLNFQAFFDFFRWFDRSIGTFIEQLVPRKTVFKGTNFTIESHMLERAKQEYYFNQIYLGDSVRNNLDSFILLQQIAGSVKKF